MRWYQNAIIYQIHLRAFSDSNGDGIGDLPGLIGRLDYLQDLGVTAIWILPFYPSPLKDDGYDIADYYRINPDYGTLKDFKELLKEAHKRGLKVITELVINHTSDQHEWFQKSRRAAPGSYWREFYVWSDDPRKYKEARIIFKDFETSNWAWDPLARSYYWHRFYSHQPDLNFDNPEVRKAILKVMDFWMDLGVDGMRLDAIPYLFEREGTSCENLPETHGFLKEMRAHLDRKHSDRMLLAEANQWPEDAVPYFGDGDECHMCFHFPLMPRLFMAIRMEDRYSIVDILKQTPPIPEGCQWATFLRNHDELTLEMVTDEERDYMHKVYADDPRARINLGIRRRLAPLVGNDRRQIELLNALLFCLPGTPVIYYGDEIGMGDNIFLGDRNGVRTPFQWSPDRNAGFSRANPQSLFLPVIIAPEYHYEAINVENQQANSNSLLWWMKRMIAVRKSHPEFGTAPVEFIHSDNPKVLSFVRRTESKVIAVVANLSRNMQYAEIDWREFQGRVPTELLGGTELPEVGETPYFVSLSPYAFYWFELEERESAGGLVREPRAPVRAIDGGREPLRAIRTHSVWKQLQPELLRYLHRMRWFAGKARKVTRLELLDLIPLGGSVGSLIQVNYSTGEPERYLVPIAYSEGERADHIRAEWPDLIVAEKILRQEDEVAKEGILHDAAVDPDFARTVLDAILRRRVLECDYGVAVAETSARFRRDEARKIAEPVLRGTEQSNTSIVFGQEYYLKVYRRLEEGLNPEVEIGRRFAASGVFDGVAPLLGTLEYRRGRDRFALGILQGYRESQGDGWDLMLDQLSLLSEQALTLTGNPDRGEEGELFEIMAHEPPAWLVELSGYALGLSELLGERTGQMHSVLGAPTEDPAFCPEPFTPFYQRSLYQSIRNVADRTLSLLRKRIPELPESTRRLAWEIQESESQLYRQIGFLKERKLEVSRIRVHGDFHLGQTLFTGKDFIIVDFEGEPSRSIGERRIKRCGLRDVAGMIRSFDYAGEYFLQERVLRDEDRERLKPVVEIWKRWMGARFLRGYERRVRELPLLPADLRDAQLLLRVYLLEKILYELQYELNLRPDWAAIPMRGIREITLSAKAS